MKVLMRGKNSLWMANVLSMVNTTTEPLQVEDGKPPVVPGESFCFVDTGDGGYSRTIETIRQQALKPGAVVVTELNPAEIWKDYVAPVVDEGSSEE